MFRPRPRWMPMWTMDRLLCVVTHVPTRAAAGVSLIHSRLDETLEMYSTVCVHGAMAMWARRASDKGRCTSDSKMLKQGNVFWISV